MALLSATSAIARWLVFRSSNLYSPPLFDIEGFSAEQMLHAEHVVILHKTSYDGLTPNRVTAASIT